MTFPWAEPSPATRADSPTAYSQDNATQSPQLIRVVPSGTARYTITSHPGSPLAEAARS